MPELTLDISISPGDLEKLQQLPGQITTLVNTTRDGLQSVLSGSDTSNPLGALLDALPAVAERAGDVPGIDVVAGAVQELVGRLPAGSLADVTAVARSVEQALGIFGPVVEALRDGGLEQGMEAALAKARDASGRLLQDNTELAQVTDELQEFFRLFRAMLLWRTTPPRPEDVVDLLSRALIGIAPDLLAAPAAALDAALGPLEAVIPAGGDRTLWQGATAAQLSFWQALDARLSAGGSVDWPALEAELEAARRSLMDLLVVRDRLLATTVANVNRVTLDSLDAVGTALAVVPRLTPTRMTPIFDGLRRQLQGIVQELDEFDLSADDFRLVIRGLVNEFFAAIERSPLGELRRLMIDFQQRFLRAIESLPFQALAHEAEAALRSVASSLEVVDPDAIRRPIHAFFEDVRGEIESFGGDTVRDAVAQLWGSVETAFDDIADQLEVLRAALQGAVDGVADFVESTQEPLQRITDIVDQIKAALDSFDLATSADEVIAQLNSLRDTISQVDVSNLPAIAVDGLKQAAEALRAIDITGAVRGPLDDALAVVDPTPLLEQAIAGLSGVSDQLQMLDPSSIVGKLDKPVDDLLATLSEFGPRQLERLIDAALEPLRAAVREIDFAPLLAPLTRLYAELRTRVDAVLDPELIFGPLEALYQPVIDLVDQLDPARLVDLITPGAEGLTGNVGQSAGPPAAIAAEGGVLRQELQSAVDVDDELFGFRPGDLLVPLIDLHHKLLETFDALADTVLEPAAGLLQQSLHGRLRALDPAAIARRIDAALGALDELFGTVRLSTGLAEAALAYGSASRRITAAASLSLSTSDQTIAARVTLRLPELTPQRLLPDLVQHDALVAAAARIRASSSLQNVRSSFAGIGPHVESLLPPFLRTEDFGAQALRQALRDLDPAPIRVEINALFDQFGEKIVALQDALIAAIEEIGRAVEEFLLPVSPGNLLALASRLHAAATQQVVALGPATFKDEVGLIFDVVKRQLGILDPAPLVAELNSLRDELLERLDDLVRDLLPDTAPFDQLVARLAAFKPSQVLAPVVEALAPLSELVEALDPRTLLEPLIEAIARVREQLPDVIASVERAFDEVLAAFPEGGIESVSATVEVG